MSIIAINDSENIAERFISSVKANDIIELSPGEYFFDTVPVLQDGITIRPAKSDSSVILNGKFFVMGSYFRIEDMRLNNHNGSIIFISNENASVVLDNCNLSHNSSRISEFAMVYVEKGKFEAYSSKFHDSPSNAVLVKKSSFARLEKCLFYNTKKVSIFVDKDSSAYIEYSNISNNENSGIRVSDNSDLYLAHSEIVNCGYSGVAVVKNSRALINDTVFKEMPLNAIYVDDKSYMRILVSNFHDINKSAIYINKESSVRLENLNFTDINEDLTLKDLKKPAVKATNSSAISLYNRNDYLFKYGPNCFDIDSSSMMEEYGILKSTSTSILTIRDKKDVQSVLSRLKSGNVIEIYPGNYFFGDVNIPNNINNIIIRPVDDRFKPHINAKFIIKGADIKFQNLVLYNNNGSIIRVEDEKSYVFIENCDISQPDSTLKELSAVYVKEGKLFIINSEIHDSPSNGLLVEKGLHITLENVKFNNTKKSCIFMKGKETKALIKGCNIKNTLNNGLTALDAGHILLENSEFSNCNYAAVYLNNSNMNITNLNVNHSSNVVYAKNGSYVSIIDSKFYDISKSVFLVQDPATQFNMHKNIVLYGKGNINGYFIERIDNDNVKIDNEEDYRKRFRDRFMK